MNKLQVFSNVQFGSLETILINGQPWFGATEVALMLGYSNPHKAIGDHCRKDGVTKREVIDSLGRKQQMNFVTEGNLYRLIAKSKLPSAEEFESWVFDEVLPSFRKNGLYATDELLDNPDLLIKVATQLKEEREARKLLEEENTHQLKELEYKDEVIVGLVDEVDLMEKRQTLNRIVRKPSTNYQERWNELYYQFEKKYHIDLSIRIEKYNKCNKPKIKGKLDYIDKVMGKLPELYEIACKLYANDVDRLVKQMYEINVH